MMVFNDILDGRYCVYFHTVDREIFYIGSGRVTRAFECTRAERSKSWHEHRARRPVSVTLFEFFEDPNEARRREYQLIKLMKPVANVHGIGRPPKAPMVKKVTKTPKPAGRKTRTGKAVYAQELGKGPRVWYASGKAAAEATGIPACYVSRCVKGFRREFGGFSFTYAR